MKRKFAFTWFNGLLCFIEYLYIGDTRGSYTIHEVVEDMTREQFKHFLSDEN